MDLIYIAEHQCASLFSLSALCRASSTSPASASAPAPHTLYQTNIAMISTTFLSISLFFSTLAVTTEAAWFRHAKFHIGRGRNIGAEQQQESWYPAGYTPDTPSSTVSRSYTYSVPNVSIIAPTMTSQGMTVTSIVPLYEVCNTPGSNTTSCSTVFETFTTTTCSTVLTYAFSATTVTECAMNITFSTQSSYALATTTIPPPSAHVQKRQQLPPTSAPTSSSQPATTTTATYVESVVSYWYAPWQSLAANTPQGITLLVCKYDYFGVETCTSVQEVWVVSTEYVLVSTTSALMISTSLTFDAVFLLAPSQSVTAPAGNFTLSTQILHSSMVANATTTVSTLTSTESSTLTTTSTTTITITGPPSTVTMTLSALPTLTTIESTTVTTSTVTVLPMMQRRVRERIQIREETLAEALLRE